MLNEEWIINGNKPKETKRLQQYIRENNLLVKKLYGKKVTISIYKKL